MTERISSRPRRTWPLLLLLLGHMPAIAQDPAPPLPQEAGSVLSYPNDFFAEFRPSTALDMITRIPGFTYDQGDSDVRGLAGSGGNVLMDGKRPSIKSLSLDDVIRRIPAAAVARIEVIRGSSPGIDMGGQPIVANIVRVSGSRRSIAAELLTKFYSDHEPARGVRLEASRAADGLTLDGSFNWRQEKEQGQSGVGRLIRRDGAGRPLQLGRFEAAGDRGFVQGSGSAEYRYGASLVRLSLSGEQERQDRLDTTRGLAADGSIVAESVATDDLNREGEFSLVYERTVATGLDARLLVLEARERDEVQSSSSGRDGPQRVTELSTAGESIVRAAVTYVPQSNMTFDARVERAFNFLEAASSLSRNGVPISIPADNIRLEERRIDAAGSGKLQAWDGGTLEAGLSYERSTISLFGDAQHIKALSFWKPRFNASIDPAPGWQVRLTAERAVGQLDFEDFASTASLDTDTVSAGNPELEPEKSWFFEALLERRFWERGAATLIFHHALLEDVIDLVPIEGRFDAPGNIGSGTRQELTISLVLPLKRVALSGALVRFKGTRRWSAVIDPFTLAKRRISDQRPFEGEVLITQDLPALRSVLGADFYFGWEERDYRISEIRTERASTDPLVRVYWDWTPSPRTSLRFQVENFTFRNRQRDRILFAGPRRLGIISVTENRTAVLDPFLMIRLRRTF